MKDYDFDVFLSHNKADQAAVETLANQLEKSGLKVWLDHWNLLPGDPWQDEIEEALDRSRTMAVFVGPSGIGGWHNEEMRSALETRVRNQNRRVIPVLLSGAVEPELPRFLRRLHWVDFRNGLEDEATFNLFVVGITGKRQVKSDLRTTISNHQRTLERKSDFAPDSETPEGELLFEDESNATSSVKASWLATLLRDSGVRLAFLNACKTAHAADGVAEVLVRREVPAALGMQVSVRDDVAVAFSANFYAALADGWPVDAAVVEGRKAIVNALNNDPDQPDWVHPVLYMRAPDGVLFG